jgi:hypothetical protein
MGRFNRFLHLEKERTQKDGEPEAGSTPDARAARFGGVQPDVPVPPPPPGGPAAAPHAPRFEQAPGGPRELALDEKRAEDQPFIRCATCEGDNNRFAQECQHCHADLNTPAQRAFNEQLWTTLRAQKEAEAAAHAEKLAAQLQAAEQEARGRREMFEQMAREVRRETEGRLSDAPLGLSSRWGRGRLRLGNPRTDLGSFVGIAVVVLVLMGTLGSCRSALGLLPILALAGGFLFLRHVLRRL